MARDGGDTDQKEMHFGRPVKAITGGQWMLRIKPIAGLKMVQNLCRVFPGGIRSRLFNFSAFMKADFPSKKKKTGKAVSFLAEYFMGA
jgi:hypothetical protein